MYEKTWKQTYNTTEKHKIYSQHRLLIRVLENRIENSAAADAWPFNDWAYSVSLPLTFTGVMIKTIPAWPF